MIILTTKNCIVRHFGPKKFQLILICLLNVSNYGPSGGALENIRLKAFCGDFFKLRLIGGAYCAHKLALCIVNHVQNIFRICGVIC